MTGKKCWLGPPDCHQKEKKGKKKEKNSVVAQCKQDKAKGISSDELL